MADAEELATAKRSFNAHKGVFGRLAKTFEARLASYRKNPETVHNWTEFSGEPGGLPEVCDGSRTH